MLDWIGNLCNRINDWDLTWVGFRSFRPAKDQDMSARVVLALSLVYCPVSAVMAFAVSCVCILVFEHAVGKPSLIPMSAAWTLGALGGIAFPVFQCVLASSWNRRAARLRESASRSEHAG